MCYYHNLVGENAGRPLRSVAETRAGPLAIQKEAVGTTSILADARKVSLSNQAHIYCKLA